MIDDGAYVSYKVTSEPSADELKRVLSTRQSRRLSKVCLNPPFYSHVTCLYFRDANSSYSGYKSAHAHKSTRVMQSRTTRVVNKMATSYGY